MSQDITSDALNQIMNAKRAGKTEVRIKRHSKFLISVLELMKRLDYLDYKTEDRNLTVQIKKINECKAIKPRFSASIEEIDKYVRRFIPSRNMGYVILSTNKGILTHDEAIEQKIGGSLVAYIF